MVLLNYAFLCRSILTQTQTNGEKIGLSVENPNLLMCETALKYYTLAD
jgi:hypothetical protein